MSMNDVINAEHKLEQKVVEQACEIDTLRNIVKNQAERIRVLSNRDRLQFSFSAMTPDKPKKGL